MSEKLKAFVKNKNNLILLVLIGVLLMVITLPVEKEGEENTNTKIESNNNGSYDLDTAYDSALEAEEGISEEQSYVLQMESKLEEALSQLYGAGRVEVVITLEASEEKVVEKDIPVVRSNTEETDSAGGTRTVSSVDMGESTVFSTEESNSQPYVIKKISPQIEGVVVLAEGAGSGNVSNNISEAVQVLFGIDAHKIKVMKMKGTK